MVRACVLREQNIRKDREHTGPRAAKGHEEPPRIRADPRRADQLLARAIAFEAQGRDDEAQCAYLETLGTDPGHFQALLGLGTLLMNTTHRQAARTALLEAIHVRPDSAAAHTGLATLLADNGETAQAREHYETALRLDSGYSDAHKGLAVLLFRSGETQVAERHGRLGFHGRPAGWRYRGAGHPPSLLLVLSAQGGNIPLGEFVTDRSFRKWTLVPEFCDPSAELPPHDIVFNAVGDPDLSRIALERSVLALSRTRAPVLNPPSRVLLSGRAGNAARLSSIPGVIVARTEEVAREILESPAAASFLAEKGFTWPLLLRSPGFHTGEHFVKVSGPEHLSVAIEGLPGARLLVIQFIDTVSSDGMYRKYRVMMIDGDLFPLHLAVSPNWKVHYFTAAMNDPKHRAEDEAFLSDMPAALGPKGMQALRRVQAVLGLDYAGCDFALDMDGNVVVFEANATMIIVEPGKGPFAYRAASVERVQGAVTRMLLSRAGRLILQNGHTT